MPVLGPGHPCHCQHCVELLRLAPPSFPALGEAGLFPMRPQQSLSCLKTSMIHDAETERTSPQLCEISTNLCAGLAMKKFDFFGVCTYTKPQFWFLKVWHPERDNTLKGLNQNYGVLSTSSFQKESHIQKGVFPNRLHTTSSTFRAPPSTNAP